MTSDSEHWLEIKNSAEDPYSAMEAYLQAVNNTPKSTYAPIAAQIDVGWEDSVRGAIARHLVDRYLPSSTLAAYILLGGTWPAGDPTAILNLLALAHRVEGGAGALGALTCRAALKWVTLAMRDRRNLIAEEALNVLGGMSGHHFQASSQEIADLLEAAETVAMRIDDEDLAQALLERAKEAASRASTSCAPTSVTARRAIAEIETAIAWLELEDSVSVAILAHARALVWAGVSDDNSAPNSAAVQVLRIAETGSGTRLEGTGASVAWSFIERWFEVVMDRIGPDRSFLIVPLDVARGSLIVTVRIDADEKTCDEIARLLSSDELLVGSPAEHLLQTLGQRELSLRVDQVSRDHSSSCRDMVGTRVQRPAKMITDPASEASSPRGEKKLLTADIPQANEWNKIFAVLDCIADGLPVTSETIQAVDRQVLYYRAAARILGLVTTPEEKLTRVGWLLRAASGDARLKRACTAFECSPCGQSWIQWSGGSGLRDIPLNTAAQFLRDRSELSGDTVSRRASTLNHWLKLLRDHA